MSQRDSEPTAETNVQSTQEPQPNEEEEITPETMQQINNLFIDASTLLKSFNDQSSQLRESVGGIFETYGNATADMVPKEQIQRIMATYQQTMKEAQKENAELAKELQKEEQERDQLVADMQSCFQKLDLLEEKIKKKMELKRQKEEAAKAQVLIQAPEEKQ